MSAYTDNLAAAVARGDAAEKKVKELKAEVREAQKDNDRLKAQLDEKSSGPMVQIQTQTQTRPGRHWIFYFAIGVIFVSLVLALVGFIGPCFDREATERIPITVERFQSGELLSGALQGEYDTTRYHETCSDVGRTLAVTARGETAIVVVRVWRRGSSRPSRRIIFRSTDAQSIYVAPGCSRFAVHGYDNDAAMNFKSNSSNTAGLGYELTVQELP